MTQELMNQIKRNESRIADLELRLDRFEREVQRTNNAFKEVVDSLSNAVRRLDAKIK